MAIKPLSRRSNAKPQRNAEATRRIILDAALEEFAAAGLAGARTGSIARAARVNKALIHYYFKSKHELYLAVLEHVFAGLFLDLRAALDRETSPREKLLSYTAAYFDFIVAAPLYPRLVAGEMMRSGGKPSPHLLGILKRHAGPVMAELVAIVAEGIRRGEVRKIDPFQVPQTILGVVVFYFVSSQNFKHITGRDPLTPQALTARRAAVLDFVTHAFLVEQDTTGKAVRARAPRKGRSR